MNLNTKIVTITTLLKKHYPGCELILEDESYKHTIMPGKLTHIKIILVTEKFLGVARVLRHQEIFKLLKTELAYSLHAIAMHLFTPAEWQAKTDKQLQSPNCARN